MEGSRKSHEKLLFLKSKGEFGHDDLTRVNVYVSFIY
jgi:hypothetical protein